MNNDKQSTQGNQMAPFSLDKMREAIEGFNYNKALEPLKNVYVNEQGWQRLLTEVSGFTMSASMDRPTYCGLLIISDNDVPHNLFMMCTAEDWGYYKKLCSNDIVNVAALTDNQINYCIQAMKRADTDTLSDLVYPYTAPFKPVEIEESGFEKGFDSDTTT